MRPLGNVEAAIAGACSRIAPLWPLKHFVAVNPFLGFSGQTFHATCATMHRVARVDMLMPRAFYRERDRGGRDRGPRSRGGARGRAAATGAHRARSRSSKRRSRATRRCERPSTPPLVATVAEVLDSLAGGDRNASRTAFMIDEISKWCAAYFDEGQSVWRLPSRGLRPYAAWRAAMRTTATPK